MVCYNRYNLKNVVNLPHPCYRLVTAINMGSRDAFKAAIGLAISFLIALGCKAAMRQALLG
ncbi:MAG: hypothetical protein ACON35_01115 [Candidatus Marinamargulisbacteria bacterium]